MTGRTQISVTVSGELLAALDAEAYAHDEPRAATIRKILADYLRGAGQMALRAPPLASLGQTNHLYRPQEGRA